LLIAIIAALSPISAMAQRAAPPQVPQEWLDRERQLEGDTVKFCINNESLLAPFERDMATALASALLLEPDLVEVRGARAQPILDYRLAFNEQELFLLMHNNCHVLMGYVLSTSRSISWLMPSSAYAEFGYVVIGRPGVGALSDLPAGSAVGTKLSGSADIAFTRLVNSLPENRRWRRVPYVNNQLLIDKLSAEELDAIIVWEPAATAAAADELQNGTFVRLDSRPLDLPTVLFGLAVLREDAFLRNQLDAAIQQLVSDGTVEDLLAKHGLPGRAPR
jgi:polar amino acid transport system substrate-binding protein